MQSSKVDREKNLIIYRKVQDIKGKHPQDVIKHNIGRGGLRPGEWQEIMEWAEVGKQAVFFHNGGASETCIGTSWYQAYPQGEWWDMSHGEPFLLRSYAGKVEKLPAFVTDILAGKEVVVPCMVDGDKEAIHKKTARIQRLKASLKLHDYNPKRDFVGWGGEDFRRLAGMPGFDRYAGAAELDAEAQSVSTVDFDGDGKPDLCLCGANKVVLLQNGGDGFSEIALPGPHRRRPLGGVGRLQRRRPARPAARHAHRPEAVHQPRQGPVPRRHQPPAEGSRVQPHRRRVGRLRRRRQARHPARQRLPRPAALPEHAPGHAEVRAAEARRLALDRHVPRRQPRGQLQDRVPVEKEKFDREEEYKGKRDIDTQWKKKQFKDGEVDSLAEFGQNCANYLYREIEAASGDRPAGRARQRTTRSRSGSTARRSSPTTDGSRSTEPRVEIVLKLKPGKNTLLMKICNGGRRVRRSTSAPGTRDGPPGPWFADVSAAWGLGPDGLGADVKGDTLAVADFNGDGSPTSSTAPAPGMLFVNDGGKFALKADSGISYKPGKVGPASATSTATATSTCSCRSRRQCKLFRNDGNGKFTDVTAQERRPRQADPGRGVRRVGRLRQRRQARPGRRLPARLQPLLPQQGRRHVRGQVSRHSG